MKVIYKSEKSFHDYLKRNIQFIGQINRRFFAQFSENVVRTRNINYVTIKRVDKKFIDSKYYVRINSDKLTAMCEISRSSSPRVNVSSVDVLTLKSWNFEAR